MKKIQLKPCGYALVDNDDFDYLNLRKWYLSTGGYAYCAKGINGKSIKTRMHRMINNTPDGFLTDHINRNKLDNRKCNLRTVTKSINMFNRDAPQNNRSGHKGVYFENWSKKWRAEIKINYKKIPLGRFDKIEDAIKARQLGEEKYLNEHAQLSH